MAADASAYGIGAVISHVYPNSEEKPIAFASRTLSPAEVNYAQIEKEALSLVFGIQHFHQYLYGRHFTMVTDHKPLMAILGPKHGIPALAAARLQRWAVQLSAYHYDIEFRPQPNMPMRTLSLVFHFQETRRSSSLMLGSSCVSRLSRCQCNAATFNRQHDRTRQSRGCYSSLVMVGQERFRKSCSHTFTRDMSSPSRHIV